MSETALVAGGWVAAGLTLFMFSFLWRDNPFFRAAEHLYLGAGMGWVFQATLYQTWLPRVWRPLLAGDLTVLVPALLGLTLVAQFFPRLAWISRYGFTFMVGYGAGLAIPPTLSTDFLRQVGGAIAPFADPAATPLSLLNALVAAAGFVCVLVYFFFSVEQRGPVKKASAAGLYFLVLYFGAAFGNTVMGRFSALYGRFDELYVYSGRDYFYATHALLAGLCLYFAAGALRRRRYAAANKKAAG
jgi:hypothetical protein